MLISEYVRKNVKGAVLQTKLLILVRISDTERTGDKRKMRAKSISIWGDKKNIENLRKIKYLSNLLAIKYSLQIHTEATLEIIQQINCQ